jgi:uncharacterized cupredoxin-like copper-binding protein
MNFTSDTSSVCTALFCSALLLGTTAATAGGDHAGGHHESPVGKPGVATRVTRTITVEMVNGMRFKPSAIQVKQGQTIRFVLKNMDGVKHEFTLGTPRELAEHYELMKKFPDMVHAEPNQVSVEPGQQGEVIWQFSKAGTVDFACLHVGHFDAGMKGRIMVAAK